MDATGERPLLLVMKRPRQHIGRLIERLAPADSPGGIDSCGAVFTINV
jgi:hypothetical protein